MSAAEPIYRANLPAVAHETFEDEAILIHFESGRYYSLNATGKAVWAELVAGASVADVTVRLAGRYAADEATLRAAIGPFVEELAVQGLVIAAGDGPVGGAAAAPTQRAGSDAPRQPFAAPHVEVFSDMQDLLMLDPIHDVDEAGWPHGRE